MKPRQKQACYAASVKHSSVWKGHGHPFGRKLWEQTDGAIEQSTLFPPVKTSSIIRESLNIKVKEISFILILLKLGELRLIEHLSTYFVISHL